jgi:hypothetical protein
MSEPEVWRCEVVDAPSGWPTLQVRMVLHTQLTDLEVGREAARQRVRGLLLREAGPEIAAPFLAATRVAPGAGRASISHAQTHSLLAWCQRGRIGIDAVSLYRLADMSPHDVLTTAEQYLGPNTAAAIMQATSDGQARTLFADAWARHEASLKCLGLALDEWSPALQGQLARCLTAVVVPPPQVFASIAMSITRIAWQL